jgi:radical SAM superfamily enzyme YgiQ (UPF0313 family)
MEKILMKILLIYPESPPSFWSMDYLLKLFGKKASYPPLGLLTIAAMLPEDWEKRLVDLNIREVTDDELAWADYVFVTGMNIHALSAQEVINRCKAVGVKVVAGGSLFTHEYERFHGVDHFILNEAEITLPPFLADLEKGEPKPLYSTPEFADIHQTPVPMWELVDLRDYGFAIVQYSRGCPYMCDFCDVTALFGRRPRTKTPEQIITELNALGDPNDFDLVLFADDNLIGNKKLLKAELLPALIEWRNQKNTHVNFATQLTINLVDDPELMQLMLEAGFRHVFTGIESPQDDSLILSKKTQNAKRDLLNNVKTLHHAGFVVHAGFIVGFDTDNPSIFQNQIDFIQEGGIVNPTVNLLKAPPGTELHVRMKNEGRLIEDFVFTETQTNIVPTMNIDVLLKGYSDVLKHTHEPEHFCERSIQCLRDYEEPDVEQPKLGPIIHFLQPRYFKAMGRILWHAGIRGRERRYFWKLIGWTLRHRPNLLHLAIYFAAMMHQFRRVYDDQLGSGEKSHADALTEHTRKIQSMILDNA